MDNHSRPAERWIVRRNKQVVRNLQPLRIEESAGGKRMDFAELIFDPTLSQKMQDYSPLDDLGYELEIEAVKGGIKHVGIVTQVLPVFSPQGEKFKVVSQTQPFLFGDPIGGLLMFNPNVSTGADPMFVKEDIIFNPKIDGKIRGNMHSELRIGPGESHIFLDPLAVVTEAAQKLHRGRAIMWTLSKAVHYLCSVMNLGQKTFRNPTLRDLERFAFTDSIDHVRNIKIEYGVRLPEALDSLVGPIGYSWRLQTERGRRNFSFHKRGTGGRLAWLNHQRYGEVFDPLKTNVETQGVVFDAGRLANKIVAHGSPRQIEITVELVKAWDPKFDEWSRDKLRRTNLTDDAKEEDPGVEHAWRRWALNEGGAYIGLRPEIKTIFAPGVKAKLQQLGVLEHILPRPRKLLPTLTLRSDDVPIGATSGIDIEWSDDGEHWFPVGKWQIDLLEHEAGINIGSNEIPEELIDAADQARLRVTAAIELDRGPIAWAAKDDGSPLRPEIIAALDLSSQFHWKEVTTLSKFHGSGRPSIAVDDRSTLQAYVEELRKRFDNLDVAGAVTLEGVDQHNYRVGDRVAGVKGKNISFKSRADGTTYPQIAAITYDIEGQKTILHMSRVRETVVL